MNEKEQLQQLKDMVAEFEKSVKKIIETALNLPKGGDSNWYQLIEQYGVEPSTEDQKNAYYSKGIPVSKGALPTEIRNVFKFLRHSTIKKYRDKFENIELSVDAEVFWNDFVVRLRDFIEDEVSAYVGKIKQEVNVSNIFANAFSSMNQFSNNLKESGTDTKKCNSCGSPRHDEDQYDECYFCGTPLFETKEIEAKCNICSSPKFIEDQGKECQFCGN